MASDNGLPVLWQFRQSHFNEKARWALDWKGVRHERRSLLPGPHMPVMLVSTGQKQVPVLQIDGTKISDSTRIIAELERRSPTPPLYPADPAAKQRALELEDFFDTEIGPHLRRVFFHAILPDADFTAGLMSTGFGPLARSVYRAAFPATRVLMRMDMGIDDTSAARSLERFEAALDRLEREIQPSGFLPVTAGMVRENDIVDVYRNSPIFKDLRNPDIYKGVCGTCEYRDVCGGQRGRAYGVTGDYLESDPACVLVSGDR